MKDIKILNQLWLSEENRHHNAHFREVNSKLIGNAFNEYKAIAIALLSDLYSIRTYIEVGVWKLGTFEFMNSRLSNKVEMYGFDMFGRTDFEEYAPTHWIREGDFGGYDYTKALDIISNWERDVFLINGNTKETLKDFSFSNIKSSVLVFLDGGHSYETVKSDFWYCYNNISNGIIVLDDCINPDFFGTTFKMYGYEFDFPDKMEDIWNLRIGYGWLEGVWTFVRELHDNDDIDISYISDVMDKKGKDVIKLESLGVVKIQ